MTTSPVESVSKNFVSVLKQIEMAAEKSGRDPADICLVTVTKTVPVEKVNEAVRAGAQVIGENKVQEARDKFPMLSPCIRHLIGNLQKNKVKYVFDLFEMIQSVHSFDLAVEIDRRAVLLNRKIDILVQVNIGNEKTKYGIAPNEAVEFFKKTGTLKNVVCKGLMCIPPFSEYPESSRPYFKTMVKLRNEIEQKASPPCPLTELSMGMTNDFSVAIEEGATIVRVGRAIFGGRT
ncbi:MAG: YggS family pyridoxal phosphate-dependent enzyme [Nitrospinota bacterium]